MTANVETELQVWQLLRQSCLGSPLAGAAPFPESFNTTANAANQKQRQLLCAVGMGHNPTTSMGTHADQNTVTNE